MPIFHVLILGAGPAGLASALAISQSMPEMRITVLELRPPSPSSPAAPLGGAVNLTPLAMRYLDRLPGVGERVRRIGIPVRAIDNVSLRTGGLLGRMWEGVDGVRVHRGRLVGVMRDAVAEAGKEKGTGGGGGGGGRGGGGRVEIRYGVRVVGIVEGKGRADGNDEVVRVELEGGEVVVGDILLGCDGLHSVVRRLYVDPERRETYSGKVVAYGFAKAKQPGDAGLVGRDGRPLLEDTAMFMGRYGAMVVTFYEPKREKVFVGGVMPLKEASSEAEGDGRDGWKTKGSDKEYVKGQVRKKFGKSAVVGLGELLETVDDWTLYPVYMLPPGGRWSRGRVLLLGDAAHAMPPMGESMGVAIEDGALIARVLTRHGERTVNQLFADYETLRRPTIDKIYEVTVGRWNMNLKEDHGWLGNILWDYATIVFLALLAWKQNDSFAGDVSKLELPA